jgi:hypothetical protein
MALKEAISKEQNVTMDDINTKFMYVLHQKNEKRGKIYDEAGNPRGEPEYKPRRNLLLRSSILWPGGIDPFSGKQRAKGKHIIRYYDGCTTLFIDDQPKDKETIDQLVSNTREMVFQNGYLSVYGYETLLKNYMDWCSYNVDSPYRVPTVEIIFMLLDSEKSAKMEAEQLELVEQAMELSKKATEKKMLVHAKYLGIPFEDMKSGNQLSPSAIRTAYRKYAMDNPSGFIYSYNDKSIQTATYIQTALETGVISTTLFPNKAVWSDSKAEICDISGIKSQDGIINRLIEFSQTQEGGSFDDQLRALYK